MFIYIYLIRNLKKMENTRIYKQTSEKCVPLDSGKFFHLPVRG